MPDSDNDVSELRALSRLLDYVKERASTMRNDTLGGEKALVLFTLEVAQRALAAAVNAPSGSGPAGPVASEDAAAPSPQRKRQ